MKKIRKVKKKITKERVIRTRGAGSLTEAQYFFKIRAILRNGFRYWKPAYIALERASRPSQSTNKRLKKEYKCAMCGKWFKRTDVEIDHIEECGSLSCYDDIVPFLKRLTKENPDDFQILCKEDHKKKGVMYKMNRNIKNE